MECCCDTGKQIFGCNHPLYALAHAAWLHNRCRVSFGQTAFERATGRCYTGRLAQLGERVFGFIRQERKGDPKGLPAIWLGKTLSNDVHCLLMKVLFSFQDPFEESEITEIFNFRCLATSRSVHGSMVWLR